MSNVTAVPLRAVPRAYVVWLIVGILAAMIAGIALAKVGNAGTTTASGLRYVVLKKGDGGPHPTDSDIALVQYVGKLTDGTVFDQSQQPTPMPVVAADPATGRPGVVPGFSEALKLMDKGAKYRFWIKPELGYGSEAKGPIPANSTLVFDVELLGFLPEAQVRAMQQQMMMQGGGGMPGGAAPPTGN